MLGMEQPKAPDINQFSCVIRKNFLISKLLDKIIQTILLLCQWGEQKNYSAWFVTSWELRSLTKHQMTCCNFWIKQLLQAFLELRLLLSLPSKSIQIRLKWVFLFYFIYLFIFIFNFLTFWVGLIRLKWD